jgi:hypothetical protein
LFERVCLFTIAEEEGSLKFKTEVSLLVAAILLFVIGAFFYSYQISGATFAQSLASYPYQSYGLAFAGFGSILMVTASVSYSKRSKNIL